LPGLIMTREETQARPKRQKDLERPQRVRQFVLRHVLRTVPLPVLERGLSVSSYAQATALYDSGDDVFGGDNVLATGTNSSAARNQARTSSKQRDIADSRQEDSIPPYLRHPSLHRSLDAAFDSIYHNSVTEKIGDLIHTLFK
jgi:hypothetical protein